MSDSTGITTGAAMEAVVEAAARRGRDRAARRTRGQAGWVGTVVGVVAAGAATGLALERLTVGRGMRRQARLTLDATGPYGGLRGRPGTVVAEDGTELYYETEDAEAREPVGRRKWPGALWRGSGSAPLTVVFSHGYCLNQDSWHFQRAALRGGVRAVYWDQRSHGRSERGRDQSGGRAATIDQLGRDLRTVIEAAAPEGPLVLVGHSMGGMTVMALAEQFPELIEERVAGVVLVGTSAGKLGTVSLGLPAAGARALRVLAPGVLRMLGTQVDLVERGRRATADLFAGIVKRYSFGSEVDPGVARFAERMIESTPIDVVAEFYPAFIDHEKAEALTALGRRPVLVLAGENDLLTPCEHSAVIAEKLPGAKLVVVEDAGHLVMLEHSELVNSHLVELLAEVADAMRVPLPAKLRRPAHGGPADPAG